MSRVLVVQHDHVSPPGPVGERFADRGYDVVEHLVEPDLPAFTGYDAVVVMGSVCSAYDATLGWIAAEREELREADAAGVPVLGICFGGQQLAATHGGAVTASPYPELGWTAVTVDSEFAGAVGLGGPWFQWHSDRWSLPPGATELAHNAAASQAFGLRANLAVQFHPELTPAMLAGWLAHGGERELLARGLDPDAVVAETERRAGAARERAHRLVDGFLDRAVGQRGVGAVQDSPWGGITSSALSGGPRSS